MKKKIEKTISEGDFVLIDYVGKVKDSGEIFDTTLEEEAKKANIYSEKTKYGPMLVVVGERWVVEGLDKSLVGRKENEEYTVEVPPEEGFGRRDSKKIVTTTIRKLRKAGYEGDLAPGVVLNVNGAPAIVRAVVSGRVMLDFNPPLAGKTLIYEVKIRKIVKDRKDKIRSLIERHIKDGLEELKIEDQGKKVKIDLGRVSIDKPEIHLAKRDVANDILKYINDVEEIVFIERIIKEKEESNHQEAELQQGKDQGQ